MIRRLKLFIETSEGVVADVDYEAGNYFHGGAAPSVFVSLDLLDAHDRNLLDQMMRKIRRAHAESKQMILREANIIHFPRCVQLDPYEQAANVPQVTSACKAIASP